MRLTLSVTRIKGLPGLLAFNFVDISQLSVLQNKTDLAVIADRIERIVDLFDLVQDSAS